MEKQAMPELLAPAGGMPQLKAALHYGADAVYGGMKRFGLRAYAGNFGTEELREAVALCHSRKKKFYLTMNIYPFDEDMDDYLACAEEAQRAGVDAVIVSDLGAVSLLHKYQPQLPIHISTQANTLNSAAAMAWHAMGAERVILAREMSLAQIAVMKSKLPDVLELEAFVHGAVCVSYSGRCLLSNALTGRGGNQGACAQPCRWQYRVVEEKRPGEYMPIFEDEKGTSIFSAQDLCAMPTLPKLVEAGLASLKIEGRMKTEYYVATVVSAYRRGLDTLAEGEEAFERALPGLLEELHKTSHRPGNTGFFLGKPSPCAGAEGISQTMEYVAKVMADASAGEAAPVMVKNRFYVGDSLEVMQPDGSKAYTPARITLAESGEQAETVSVAGTLLQLVFPFPVSEGDILRGISRNHPAQ